MTEKMASTFSCGFGARSLGSTQLTQPQRLMPSIYTGGGEQDLCRGAHTKQRLVARRMVGAMSHTFSGPWMGEGTAASRCSSSGSQTARDWRGEHNERLANSGKHFPAMTPALEKERAARLTPWKWAKEFEDPYDDAWLPGGVPIESYRATRRKEPWYRGIDPLELTQLRNARKEVGEAGKGTNMSQTLGRSDYLRLYGHPEGRRTIGGPPLSAAAAPSADPSPRGTSCRGVGGVPRKELPCIIDDL